MARPYKITPKELTNAVDTLLAQCKTNKTTPFLEDLALMLNIGEDTVSDYAKRPLYAQAIKKLKLSGKAAILHKLDTSKNANVNAIFLAKAVHGLIERQEYKITGDTAPLGLPKRKRYEGGFRK